MSDTTSTATPNISSSLFTEIPYGLLVPGTYVEVKPNYSQAGLLPYPARLLVVAQMSAAGKATPLQLQPLLDAAQATMLCGPGSIGEQQAIATLGTNPTIPVDIICVPDAIGAARATGGWGISGTWTEPGVVVFYAGGIRFPVPFAATDTPQAVVNNAVAVLNEVMTPMTCPVVASANQTGSPKILLTAVNAGVEGNTIDLRINMGPGEVLPPGMVVTESSMAGGTLNPSIQQVLNAIAGTWYTDIVTPWTDAANAAALEAQLDTDYTALGHLDMYAYGMLTGTYGAITAAKAPQNSRFRSTGGITNCPTPHWVISAGMAGACAQSLYNDPSRQCRGLVLPYVVAPAPIDRIPFTEKQLLLSDGICTFHVLSDGTVTIERMVSENLTDNTGTPTTAWQDINAAKVASRIRYDWRSYTAVTYPSNKLADDGSLAAEYDPTVATPNRMLGSWSSRCTVYGKQGWIEDIQNQVRAAIFQRDQNDRNRLNAYQPILRVGNLMVLAGSLQFLA